MNHAEIPELLGFAREYGAWSFNLYFLVKTGHGQQMNDLSPEKTEEMLELSVDWQDEYRPMLVRSKCAPQFKQLAYHKGVGGLESGGCMAPINSPWASSAQCWATMSAPFRPWRNQSI